MTSLGSPNPHLGTNKTTWESVISVILGELVSVEHQINNLTAQAELSADRCRVDNPT